MNHSRMTKTFLISSSIWIVPMNPEALNQGSRIHCCWNRLSLHHHHHHWASSSAALYGCRGHHTSEGGAAVGVAAGQLVAEPSEVAGVGHPPWADHQRRSRWPSRLGEDRVVSRRRVTTLKLSNPGILPTAKGTTHIHHQSSSPVIYYYRH